MSKDLWLKRIRNYAGFLGMILPWLCVLGYGIVYNFGNLKLTDGFPDSMSITYYVSPILAMVLSSASLVLITYDGYSLKDNLVTTISGIFGFMIILFPCGNSNGVYDALNLTKVGFFQLPPSVSSIIHNSSAVVFFGLLAYNSFFLFTLGETRKTTQKKIRNIVYKVCAIGMVIPFIIMALPVSFPNKTWWVEMVALTFFGISWLTKGGAFGFLNDKPSKTKKL
jgi:hypothetical protein